MVKTLCMHTNTYLKAKEDYQKAKDTDATEKKAKTKKLRDEFSKLRKCDRFAVMNRRTGFVATSDWMSKHLVITPEGKPVPKKSNSKCNPWILTLRIAITDATSGSEIALELKTQDNKPFRRVKCFDVRDGLEKSGLAPITSGYEHLFQDDDPDEEE